MSNSADKSSRMSTGDLIAALASLRVSITGNRAVSVEWPFHGTMGECKKLNLKTEQVGFKD